MSCLHYAPQKYTSNFAQHMKFCAKYQANRMIFAATVSRQMDRQTNRKTESENSSRVGLTAVSAIKNKNVKSVMHPIRVLLFGLLKQELFS